jgi:hypothetical protein
MRRKACGPSSSGVPGGSAGAERRHDAAGPGLGRRVAAAAAAGSAAGALLSGALVLSPVRPAGLAVGLLVAGVLLPLAAATGARRGVLAAGGGEDVARQTGRLAAIAAPVLLVLVLFVVNLSFGAERLGAQQVGALLVATTAAAALGARYGDAADEQAAEEEPA